MVFNIQRCSIHDGAGLRTLVFFKGCPLSCLWCANPESQSFRPEIMESANKCVGCLRCRKECPSGAIQLTEYGPRIDRSVCQSCFRCTEVCYAGAKYVAGQDYTPEELMKQLRKDRLFFSMSGGGVTFSGGEPLCHPAFLTEITRLCHQEGIHVMLESCGHGDFDAFAPALPYINAMFMDIKHIDPEVHRHLTGQDNRRILENVRRIADFGIPLTIRTPVVPGCNDDPANIRGIAVFIREIPNIREYELLAYHSLGESKYRALGRDYPLHGLTPPTKEEMHALVETANQVLEGSGKHCFYTE